MDYQSKLIKLFHPAIKLFYQKSSAMTLLLSIFEFYFHRGLISPKERTPMTKPDKSSVPERRAPVLSPGVTPMPQPEEPVLRLRRAVRILDTIYFNKNKLLL